MNNQAASKKPRKLSAKQQAKADDKRIESLFYKRCSGIQIPVLKIPAIFAESQKVIAAHRANGAEASDEVLGDAIAEFVAQVAAV